eukprot:gene3158-3627_t
MKEAILTVILLVILNSAFIEAKGCAANTGQKCGACVSDWNCYYCVKTKLCSKRPVIKPSSDECSGDWYSYKQCVVTGNLLLIIIPSVLGGLLIIFICCCYWCCCRKISRNRARKRWVNLLKLHHAGALSMLSIIHRLVKSKIDENFHRYAKEDARQEAQRESREMRHTERTAERKLKHDEIRKKYGLFKDEDSRDDGKYQRFDVA